MFKFQTFLWRGGPRAFIRLQEQLIQAEFYSGDMSIFDWTSDTDESVPRCSMLATSPKAFEENECWVFVRIHSDIIEMYKTLMGAGEDDDDKASGDESDWEDDEESEDDESESDECEDDEGSEEDEESEEVEESEEDEGNN